MFSRFVAVAGAFDPRRSPEQEIVWWLGVLFNSRVACDLKELEGFEYLPKSLLAFGNTLYEPGAASEGPGLFERRVRELVALFGGSLLVKRVDRNENSRTEGAFHISFEMKLQYANGDSDGEMQVGARCSVDAQRSELHLE